MRFASENGQGMVEYILVVGLIALIVLTAVGLFGNGLDDLYKDANNNLTTRWHQAVGV